MSGRVAPVAERVAPVTWCTTTALTLVVAGGIVMASSVPRRPPLTVPVVLLAAAVVALGAGLALLARHRPFAWGLFWRVLRWALLAYAVSAGIYREALTLWRRGAPFHPRRVVDAARAPVSTVPIPTPPAS